MALEEKLFEVEKIHTNDNPSDMLTKVVIVDKHEFCRSAVGMKPAKRFSTWSPFVPLAGGGVCRAIAHVPSKGSWPNPTWKMIEIILFIWFSILLGKGFEL